MMNFTQMVTRDELVYGVDDTKHIFEAVQTDLDLMNAITDKAGTLVAAQEGFIEQLKISGRRALDMLIMLYRKIVGAIANLKAKIEIGKKMKALRKRISDVGVTVSEVGGKNISTVGDVTRAFKMADQAMDNRLLVVGVSTIYDMVMDVAKLKDSMNKPFIRNMLNDMNVDEVKFREDVDYRKKIVLTCHLKCIREVGEIFTLFMSYLKDLTRAVLTPTMLIDMTDREFAKAMGKFGGDDEDAQDREPSKHLIITTEEFDNGVNDAITVFKKYISRYRVKEDVMIGRYLKVTAEKIVDENRRITWMESGWVKAVLSGVIERLAVEYSSVYRRFEDVNNMFIRDISKLAKEVAE